MKKRNELFEILGNTVSIDGSASNGTGATWSAGVAFKRAAGVPLEKYSLFKTLEEAKNYAKGNPVAYAGQPVAILDADEKTATLYLIQQDASLSEVGSATLGDNETIDLDVDTKKLSLHDFGKFYYAYSQDSEGNAKYTKTEITEANKSILAGLEARIVLDGGKYVLGWYEPNLTTVEGVSKDLASLKTTVQEQGNLLNGGTSVEGSVNKRIADAVASITQIKYEKVESELPESGVAGTIYLKAHGDHYKEFLWLDNKWEEIGDLDSVDLTGYYTKDETNTEISTKVGEEETRATTAEGQLSTRIKTLEDKNPEENLITDVKITDAEGTKSVVEGKIAIIDVSGYAKTETLTLEVGKLENKISGSETTLRSEISTAKTDAVGSAKTYTDTQIETVNTTITTEIGNVKTSIGTVPEGSTVINEIGKKVSTTDFESFKTSNTEAIAKAKSEAIADTGTNADAKIGSLGTKEVDGEQVAKTVKEYVDEKVTEAAPADYNTVKAQVEANKSAITAINDTSTGILAQAKADSQSKVDTLKGSDSDAADTVTVSNAIKKANAAQTAADSKVSAIKGDKSISAVKGDANTEYTVSVKISKAEGNLLTTLDDGLSVIHEDAPEYSLVKSATASGYAATYNLTKAGAIVGESINIPKDYIVKSAELKICETDNVPQQYFAVGDKYIDFTINTKDGEAGTTSETHIYLNVKELVDVYTAGNGITISNKNVVSAKVVSGNGLSVDTTGIKMASAGKDADGETYHAGAMTALDAQKLAKVAEGAEVNVLEGVLDGEGEALTITEKKVQLPMATASKLGLVKGSTGANHVQVGADGTMTVASINASTLVSDKPIRIKGGSADTDFSVIDA